MPSSIFNDLFGDEDEGVTSPVATPATAIAEVPGRPSSAFNDLFGDEPTVSTTLPSSGEMPESVTTSIEAEPTEITPLSDVDVYGGEVLPISKLAAETHRTIGTTKKFLAPEIRKTAFLHQRPIERTTKAQSMEEDIPVHGKAAEALDPTWYRSEKINEKIDRIRGQDPNLANAFKMGDISSAADINVVNAFLSGDETAKSTALNTAKGARESAGEFAAKREQRTGVSGKAVNVLESVSEMLPMIGKSAALNAVPGVGQALSTSMWAKQGAGDIITQLKDEGVDDDTALAYGLVGGLAYSLVEQVQVGRITNVGKKVVGESVKKKLLKLAKEKGLDWLQNVREEVIQGIVTENAIVDAVKASGIEVDQKEVNDRYKRAVKENFTGSAWPMGVLSALGLAGGSAKIGFESRATKRTEASTAFNDLFGEAEEQPVEAVVQPGSIEMPPAQEAVTTPEKIESAAKTKTLQDFGVDEAGFYALPEERQNEIYKQLPDEERDRVLNYEEQPIETVEGVREKIVEEEIETEPSEAQKKAGNYKKKHIRREGLEISIENAAGSTRSGTDKSGKQWSQKINQDYGYIRGTKGADAFRDKESTDRVDVFIKPGSEEGKTVYIVNQVDPSSQKFDEHKVMMGFDSKGEAEKAYLSNYESGWKGLGSTYEMPIEEFKEWVFTDKTKYPYKGNVEYKESEELPVTDEMRQKAEILAKQIPGVKVSGKGIGGGTTKEGKVNTEHLMWFDDEVSQSTKAIKASEGINELRKTIEEARKGVKEQTGERRAKTPEERFDEAIPSAERINREGEVSGTEKVIRKEQVSEKESRKKPARHDEAPGQEGAAGGKINRPEVEKKEWVRGDVSEEDESLLEKESPESLDDIELDDEDEGRYNDAQALMSMIGRLEEKKVELDQAQKLYDAVKRDLFGKIDARSFGRESDPNFILENKRLFARSGGKNVDNARMNFIEQNRPLLQELGIDEESIQNPSEFADFLRDVSSRRSISELKNEIKNLDKDIEGYSPKFSKGKPVSDYMQQDLFGGEKSVSDIEKEEGKRLEKAEIKRRIEERKGGEADIAGLPLFEDADIEGSQATLKFAKGKKTEVQLTNLVFASAKKKPVAGSIKVVKAEKGTPQYDLKSAIEEATEKEVVFIETDQEVMKESFGATIDGISIPGAISPELANKIFIDVNTQRPILWTAFHEFAHFLETNPDYKRRFWGAVKLTDRGMWERAREGDSEFAADIIGEMMSREDFWRNLAKGGRESFKRIFREFMRILQKLSKALKKVMVGTGFDETARPLYEDYIENVDELRTAVADIYSDYLKTKGRSVGNAPQRLAAAMRLFHGSPFDFSKFEMRPRTGEGAMSFGFGLYFTNTEDVADFYARKFGNEKRRREMIRPDQLAINKYKDKWDKLVKQSTELNDEIDKIRRGQSDYDKEAINKKLDKVNDKMDSIHSKMVDETIERNPIKSHKYTVTAHKGKSPSEYDYLQWDKPATDKQIKKIEPAIDRQWKKESDQLGIGDEDDLIRLKKDLFGDENSGESIYRGISNAFGGNDEMASSLLLEAGIDGIEYPAGTLSGQDSDARNFVVFDPEAVTIEEKVQFAKGKHPFKRSPLRRVPSKVPVPTKEQVEEAKEEAAADRERVKKFDREMNSLRKRLRGLQEDLLQSRAEIGLQLESVKAAQIWKLKNAIYDYAKKIGLSGVPYNKVSLILKNTDNARGLKKAIEKLDEVWLNYERRAIYTEALDKIEKEYRRIKKVQSGKAKSTVAAEYNNRLKNYLDSLKTQPEWFKGMDYYDMVDKIVSYYNQYSAKDIKKAADVSDLPQDIVQWMHNPEGSVPDSLKRLIQAMFQTSLGTMTADQLRGVIENIDSIKEIGRTVLEEREIRKREEIDNIAEEISRKIKAASKKDDKPLFFQAVDSKRRSKHEYLGRLAREAGWSFMDPERMGEWLVAWKRGDYEKLKEMIHYKLYDAETKKSVGMENAKEAFRDIHGKVDWIDAINKKHVEINLKSIYEKNGVAFKGGKKNEKRSLTLNNMMFIYANSKNPGNYAHFKGLFAVIKKNEETGAPYVDYKATEKIADDVLEQVEKHLPAEYKEAVDNMIKYYDEQQWARLSEAFERAMQIEMPKEHNYFPIQNVKTDRAESAIVADQMARASYKIAGVNKDFTKMRIHSNAPFKEFDYFNTVTSNLQQVEHYIAYNDAIREVQQFLNRSDIRKAMEGKSEEVYRQLTDWVRAVAHGRTFTSDDWVSKSFDFVRKNFVTFALGLKATTGLQQLSSMAKGLSMVNKAEAARSSVGFLLHPINAEKFADSKSSMMKNRIKSYERELAEIAEKSVMKEFAKQKIPLDLKHAYRWIRQNVNLRDIIMWHIGRIDKSVCVILWNAKYYEQKGNGASEETAIREADEVIRKTQSRGGVLYMPKIYRSGGLVKAFTIFTSDINQNINLALEMKGKFGLQSTPKNMHDMFWNIFVATMAVWLVNNAYQPVISAIKKAGGDDDPQDWRGEEYIRELVSQYTGNLPFFGDLIDAGIALSVNKIKEARGLIPDKRLDKYIGEFVPAGVEALERITTGIKRGEPQHLLEGLLIGLGVPTGNLIKMKRGAKAIKEKGIKEWRRPFWSDRQLREEIVYESMARRLYKPRPKTDDSERYRDWYVALDNVERSDFSEYAKKWYKENEIEK